MLMKTDNLTAAPQLGHQPEQTQCREVGEVSRQCSALVQAVLQAAIGRNQHLNDTDGRRPLFAACLQADDVYTLCIAQFAALPRPLPSEVNFDHIIEKGSIPAYSEECGEELARKEPDFVVQKFVNAYFESDVDKLEKSFFAPSTTTNRSVLGTSAALVESIHSNNLEMANEHTAQKNGQFSSTLQKGTSFAGYMNDSKSGTLPVSSADLSSEIGTSSMILSTAAMARSSTAVNSYQDKLFSTPVSNSFPGDKRDSTFSASSGKSASASGNDLSLKNDAQSECEAMGDCSRSDLVTGDGKNGVSKKMQVGGQTEMFQSHFTPVSIPNNELNKMHYDNAIYIQGVKTQRKVGNSAGEKETTMRGLLEAKKFHYGRTKRVTGSYNYKVGGTTMAELNRKHAP